MQRPDQPKMTTEPVGPGDRTISDTDQVAVDSSSLLPPESAAPVREYGFDWLAIGVIILIAACFALIARLHTQPANSLVPVAVLSATGCGLLVTALRKLRTPRAIGILEAAIGGFVVALFQFIAAITYPGVFDTLNLDSTLQQGFLATWGLIAICSIIFSIAGAALGHLAFAPLRPLPAKPVPQHEEDEAGVEDLQEDDSEPEAEAQHLDENDEGENDTTPEEDDQDSEVSDTMQNSSSRPARSLFSYLVSVLLLALAPTLAGYIFSAAYDFIMNLYGFSPGPYPTLRLLSSLLPWQVPVSIGLNGALGNFITFMLLWRIPLFFGNPSTFDVQALEPLVFNGAALGLLLLTTHEPGWSSPSKWRIYFLLEALLGLLLVLPADLWVLRGLEGILQLGDTIIPIRSLRISNSLTFTLDIITGPLICVSIGILLWASNRRLTRTNSQR